MQKHNMQAVALCFCTLFRLFGALIRVCMQKTHGSHVAKPLTKSNCVTYSLIIGRRKTPDGDELKFRPNGQDGFMFLQICGPLLLPGPLIWDMILSFESTPPPSS